MTDAVLSRGETSVTLPLLTDGGSLLVARDIGKPNMSVKDVGTEDPLTQDNYSAGDGFTIVALLSGASAYADAQTLAEDLIKTRATTGVPLRLDLSQLPNKEKYDVAPATGSACTISYAPGQVDMALVQLTVSVVGRTIGGSQTTQSNLSPDSGSGIKMERGSYDVTLSVDQNVVRKVGRPNAQIKAVPGELPRLIDEADPANDVFEITAELVGSNPERDASILEEQITRPPLGTNTITLHFLDNLFGLDAYPVVPEGSQALRTLFRAGETGRIGLPKLVYRVVDNP